MLETQVFDAVPVLRHLFAELGWTAENRISRKGQARYFHIQGKHIAYCAVKGDRVQLGRPDHLHRIKSDRNWIDLKDPNSLERIRLRARKLVSSGV
jgi:hypothetical protein